MDLRSTTTIKWDISLSVIVKIVGTAIVLFLIYYLQDVLVSLFIAIILMAAIAPLVSIVKNILKISNRFAITIAYVCTLTVIVTIIYLVVPPLLRQLGLFLVDLPKYTRSVISSLGFFNNDTQIDLYKDNVLNYFNEQTGRIAESAFNATIGLFSGILQAISIAVFTFYLLLEKEATQGSVLRFIPWISHNQKKEITRLSSEIQLKLGHWARGQVLLCLIVGIGTFIGLTLLQVQFALPLAVIAGILEIVPIIGPAISAVPAIIVTLAVEPDKAIFVVALYLLIQQLENSFIVPQVMKKAIGLSPIVTLLALMIGEKLMGTTGALLSLPATTAILVILDYYTKKKDKISIRLD